MACSHLPGETGLDSLHQVIQETEEICPQDVLNLPLTYDAMMETQIDLVQA